MTKRSTRRRPKTVSQKAADRDALARHVPQFRSTVNLKHQFRYLANSSGVYNIDRAQLLSLLQVQINSGPQSARLFSGVKFNRIEVRATGTNSGGSDITLTTISVEWTSNLGPTTEVSDTGTPLNPPLIITSPPRNSLASFWSITGANESEVLFILTVNSGCVIDIWLDAVMQDGQSPVLITLSAGLTIGAVFALPLDGVGSGVHLIPVSYTTTN